MFLELLYGHGRGFFDDLVPGIVKNFLCDPMNKKEGLLPRQAPLPGNPMPNSRLSWRQARVRVR